MIISLIAGTAKNNVIGYKNTLPWGMIPADMAHFRKNTLGKPIIMGNNTFKSIGKPLKDRVNIVLSKDGGEYEGCIFVSSPEDAIKEAEKTGAEEAMIIGGASVYNLFLPKADRIYLTKIDGEFEGDTFFPEIDENIWKEVSNEKSPKDEKNNYNLEFITYEKK